MSMTIIEALEEAISAIDEIANETYEGSELDDPDIAKWQENKFDAMKVLREFKDKL